MIDLSAYNVWTQIVGLIGAFFMVFAFANKGDDRFKTFLTIGVFTFGCHYFLLGAYTGLAISLISTVRTHLSKKFYKSNNMMFFFIVIYIIATLITYQKAADILPLIAGISSTIALYKLSGIPMRLCMIITSLSWIAYDFIYQSIGGLLTEFFMQTTNLITIIRLMRDKKAKTS